MDIVQLKTIIHVAELGSLSKAADRLHIAQPALSRQVRQLEEELGVYLFERHGRGMVITEAGQEVLEHAARIMDELESIRSSVSGKQSSFKGIVSIGTTQTVAEIITAPLVHKIRLAHPNLAIHLSSAFSGYLLDWLQRGELDLAITYDPPPLYSLRTTPVMMENLILVGTKESGLHSDTPIDFSNLTQYPLVLPSNRHGLRAIVDSCARKIDIKLKSSIEADSLSVLVNLVRNGFGYTILPLAPIYTQVQNNTLSIAPLVNPTPTRTLVLAFPSDRKVSPAAKFVGDTFREIATDLVTQKIWTGHML